MKISSDTYMLMQSQLLSVMAPSVEGFVNATYVKAHVDKLLEVNGCEVHDPHKAADEAIKDYYEWKKEHDLENMRMPLPKRYT